MVGKDTGEKIILLEDVELTRQTVTGWVSTNGKFFGGDRQSAEFDSCTHVSCKGCGKPTSKFRPTCRECSLVKYDAAREQWPEVVWDGVTPLYAWSYDEYFFEGVNQIEEFCFENVAVLTDLRLQVCRPVPFPEVDGSYFLEDGPEDLELPTELAEALNKLNQAIAAHKEPAYWLPGKKRPIIRDGKLVKP